MKELSKEEILEAFKRLASSPRYRLSELDIFTMAVRWMEEQNKGKESMKEITETNTKSLSITQYKLKPDYNVEFHIDGRRSITQYKFKPDYNVEFHIDGRRIGRLDFNSGVMMFEGDAEESAKVFFDALAEKFADRLKEERENEREAICRLVQDMWRGVDADRMVDAIRARGEHK